MILDMDLRVVLVQSNMQSAQPLTRFFTQRGDEVWQAWELGQAWALVGQVKPHLLVMDLHFASDEWIQFLRRVRKFFPETRMIMTNQYPDLQRELLAREQNVQVFLRQPYSPRWIEQALKRLDENTQPVRVRRRTAGAAIPGEGAVRKHAEEKVAPVRPVRVPLWVKITLPYLLLFAVAGAYLVSRGARLGLFGLAAAGILLVLLVGLYLASRITRPLRQLVEAATEVAEGNLEVKVDVRGDDEVAVLSQSFNYMVAGLQESSIYRDLLGRTATLEVREQMRQTFASGNLRLEGQQSVATLLVTDIRGFTAITEKVDPTTALAWLNEYFTHISPVVAAHGGVVNAFTGDSMLAFFGILPRLLSPKQSAVAACQAAVEMLQAIDTLNLARARRGEPALITGIGVNTGVVMAGGLGTADRLHYTIIGDTVNTAQRIEAMTRELMQCSGALVSQSTVSALGGASGSFQLEPQCGQSVPGKMEPIAVYRLLPVVENRKKS